MNRVRQFLPLLPRRLWLPLLSLPLLCITGSVISPTAAAADAVASASTSASTGESKALAGGTLSRPDGAALIPDKFLRRWDPVTFFFDRTVGPAQAGAESHPERFVTMSPAHPGAYTWLNSKTLQFRPAEAWPALSRFTFKLPQGSYSLITLMEAPIRTIPADREEGLQPVERISLTFADPLDPEALRNMLRIGLRPLPGVDDRQTHWLDQKDFDLKVIERAQRRDPASYVVTLNQPIPSGQKAIVRLRLSLEDSATESFKDLSFTTQEAFRINRFGCANLRLPVTPEGVAYGRDQALRCDSDRRQLVVEFSAAPMDLNPIVARNLLRFTPAVEGLNFRTAYRELYVEGQFKPDTLYRVSLTPVPLRDTSARVLHQQSASEFYLHFPPKPAYLQWKVGQGIVERFGPQQLPLEGRGFGRVDVRVYPLDPLNRSFWPFPDQSVFTDEQPAPPAPGEEPAPRDETDNRIDTHDLSRQLRTLGSPPVSTIVKLPLSSTAAAAHFGLDLAPHFTTINGPQQPGTYLVGLRRLDESTQRSWVRVQVTDLSLSTLDEETGVRFAVNSLSTGAPVAGAHIRIEGTVRERVDGVQRERWGTIAQGQTGADGLFFLPATKTEASVQRLIVQQGRDVLVLDPRRAPDRYADNHWRGAGDTWLQWAQHGNSRDPEQAQDLCHLFTERPVYRPEEKVYLKGYLRNRLRGAIRLAKGDGTLVVDGPGGLNWRYPLTVSDSGSFDHVFDEATAPTGEYRFHFEYKHATCGNVTVAKEAYRTPEFELRLSAPEQVALDREFNVGLTAQYYAGGQVAGQPVRWRVTQFPYTWTPQPRPGFFYSSDGRYSGRESFHGSAVIEQEAETDDNGSATLTLNPATETTAQPRSYVIEATVTGADDQTVSTTHRVLALPALVLGLKTPRFYERAKQIRPEIIVVGPDGKLIAQQPVTVRLVKREWHSHLQAGDFSQGEAKYLTDVVDRTISEQQVQSAAQPVPVELALDGAGVYVVELEAQDKLGRAQTVAVDLYAGGDEPVSWARPSSDVFTVMPDKSRYAPGETAHLVLESPFQRAHGLAIIEAPDGNRYRWFTVNNGVATFDVPIAKDQVPKLPVHFVLMRGRVPGVKPQPGTAIDLGKPATVAATSWLTVEPVEHQVTVTVDNPARALPGETIAVKIRVTDRANKPVAGEATLWLVDQAVLALGKEQRLDPIPDFITPVRTRLALQDTRNWTLGWLPWRELPGGDVESAPAEQSLLDRVTLRRDFQSVPYFNPTIKIDASGVATVNVKLPDNLTVFKLRAKVASGADRFGVATGQVAVRMPVIVQPALPRFVRPGDSFTATGIGRIVEGEGGAVNADMRVNGVTLSGDGKRALTLKLNEPQRIEYPVAVPLAQAALTADSNVSFAFAVERVADKARDGFEVQLPLRPDRGLVSQRQLIELQPGATADVPAIAEAVRPDSLRRSLLASDQVALIHMASGLNFLMQYPHGCTEQRVSKAWAFLAYKAFNDRLYRPEQDNELKRVVTDVLTWLPGAVDSNGLVSYWPGSTGYVSLTAWVTEFLIEARRAGFAIDDALLERHISSLQQALRSDYGHFINGEAYTERVMALRALAAAGRLDNAYLAELARRSNYLNLESSAEILRLLNASSGIAPTTIDALTKKVWNGIVIRLYQGHEMYGGLQEKISTRNGLILPSETRTVATILRASHAGKRPDPRLPLLTDALVTLGQGDGWGSTQANAAAMLALADLLKPKADTKQSPNLSKLTVHDSAQLQTLEVGAAQPLARMQSTSSGKFQLRSLAKQPLIVRAEAQYWPQEPGSLAPAGANGFVVNREAFRLGASGEPADKLPLTQPGTVIALTVGDIVEEHVEVVSNTDQFYVAVVVPLAAGLEPLNPKLATAPAEATPSGTLTAAPSYVAFLDDSVTYYYDQLAKGSYHFYFRTRATVPGQFTQPQAKAELMYDAAVHGESVGARVEIVAKTP